MEDEYSISEAIREIVEKQKACPHPPESKQMLKAHTCRICGDVYTLLRCMICNQWFNHCKGCTDGKLIPWE